MCNGRAVGARGAVGVQWASGRGGECGVACVVLCGVVYGLVCGGVRRCAAVCAVRGGAWWCVVVSGGVCWCVLVCGG